MQLWYDARNDVLPYWIGPTSRQPKYLRTGSAEKQQEEKYFEYLTVDHIVLEDELWTRLHEKNVPKPPKSVFENRTAEIEFLAFELWGQFGSV